MSSLAAARADNYYHPPDWDPSKESRNKYQKSHHLGDRARKLHDGILIVRFEMPFHTWCEGCGHLIGRGVRFNAEKKQIGSYHSSKIWSFTMKTPCCKTLLEIQTDPRKAEYIVVAGGRRKVSVGGAGEDGRLEAGTIEKATDAITRLEAAEDDKRRGANDSTFIAALREESSAKYKDDVVNNRELRRVMRGARREEAARDMRRRQLGLPEHITLDKERESDRFRAAAVVFGASHGQRQQNWKRDRKRIAKGSIFSTGAVAAASKKRASQSTHL